MLSTVCSAALNGIEAFPVEVEVNAGYGDTLVVIVGLPDAAVKESRDRVSTALTNSGFKFPMGRTTINLAPADVKRKGRASTCPSLWACWPPANKSKRTSSTISSSWANSR
jgi:magnesium chelatase family protein